MKLVTLIIEDLQNAPANAERYRVTKISVTSAKPTAVI